MDSVNETATVPGARPKDSLLGQGTGPVDEGYFDDEEHDEIANDGPTSSWQCPFGALGCRESFEEFEAWDLHCLLHYPGEFPFFSSLPTTVQCPFKCEWSTNARCHTNTGVEAWQLRRLHIQLEHPTGGTFRSLVKPELVTQTETLDSDYGSWSGSPEPQDSHSQGADRVTVPDTDTDIDESEEHIILQQADSPRQAALQVDEPEPRLGADDITEPNTLPYLRRSLQEIQCVLQGFDLSNQQEFPQRAYRSQSQHIHELEAQVHSLGIAVNFRSEERVVEQRWSRDVGMDVTAATRRPRKRARSLSAEAFGRASEVQGMSGAQRDANHHRLPSLSSLGLLTQREVGYTDISAELPPIQSCVDAVDTERLLRTASSGPINITVSRQKSQKCDTEFARTVKGLLARVQVLLDKTQPLESGDDFSVPRPTASRQPSPDCKDLLKWTTLETKGTRHVKRPQGRIVRCSSEPPYHIFVYGQGTNASGSQGTSSLNHHPAPNQQGGQGPSLDRSSNLLRPDTSTSENLESRTSKKRKLNDDETDEGRFSCIFKVGEPSKFGAHVKKYEHISQLLRHLKSHDFFVCPSCFKRFPDSTAQTDHKQDPCSKACRNRRCKRFIPARQARVEPCKCILTPYDQWKELFQLQYPGREVPSEDGEGEGSSPIANENLDFSFVASTPSFHDFGPVDTFASGNLPNTPFFDLEPRNDNINAEASNFSLFTDPTTQDELQTLRERVHLLQQRVEQPTRRVEELEMVLDFVWNDYVRDAHPADRLWRLMRQHAPSLLREAPLLNATAATPHPAQETISSAAVAFEAVMSSKPNAGGPSGGSWMGSDSGFGSNI